MVNRRKRLEKQKSRLADQALVDQLALDLVKEGLPGAATGYVRPSIHHPLYFCIRSHYDGSDQKWNFSTQLAWLKHQLQCMFMASDFARGLYPVAGDVTHELFHEMMGSFVKFPAVWKGADERPVTMAEACRVASTEDDTPKRHDLQWICDEDRASYLEEYLPLNIELFTKPQVKVGIDPLAFGQHFFMPEPAEEESEDLLDILFADGKGASLSEIADIGRGRIGCTLEFLPGDDPRGVYGEDHFHSSTEPQAIAQKICGIIPSWTLPCPEDDDK